MATFFFASGHHVLDTAHLITLNVFIYLKKVSHPFKGSPVLAILDIEILKTYTGYHLGIMRSVDVGTWSLLKHESQKNSRISLALKTCFPGWYR